MKCGFVALVVLLLIIAGSAEDDTPEVGKFICKPGQERFYKDCNACRCDINNNQIYACTLRTCFEDRPQCADGETKKSRFDTDCICYNRAWYCDEAEEAMVFDHLLRFEENKTIIIL